MAAHPLAAPAPVTVTGSTGEVWSLCLVAFWRRMQEPPLQTLCFTGSPPVADLLTGKASAGERKAAEDAACKVPRVFFCLSYILFADDLLASVRNKQASERTQHSTVLEKELWTRSLEALSPFDNPSRLPFFTFVCTWAPTK